MRECTPKEKLGCVFPQCRREKDRLYNARADWLAVINRARLNHG